MGPIFLWFLDTQCCLINIWKHGPLLIYAYRQISSALKGYAVRTTHSCSVTCTQWAQKFTSGVGREKSLVVLFRKVQKKTEYLGCDVRRATVLAKPPPKQYSRAATASWEYCGNTAPLALESQVLEALLPDSLQHPLRRAFYYFPITLYTLCGLFEISWITVCIVCIKIRYTLKTSVCGCLTRKQWGKKDKPKKPTCIIKLVYKNEASREKNVAHGRWSQNMPVSKAALCWHPCIKLALSGHSRRTAVARLSLNFGLYYQEKVKSSLSVKYIWVWKSCLVEQPPTEGKPLIL